MRLEDNRRIDNRFIIVNKLNPLEFRRGDDR